jgi:hypothetical protein
MGVLVPDSLLPRHRTEEAVPIRCSGCTDRGRVARRCLPASFGVGLGAPTPEGRGEVRPGDHSLGGGFGSWSGIATNDRQVAVASGSLA